MRTRSISKKMTEENRMSKKQNKKGNRLQNAKMEDKFKISFKAVYVGVSLTVLFGFLNILIYSKAAGLGLFSSFSRGVGIVLFFGAVAWNFLMLIKNSKSLSKALVNPIYELQEAVGQIKQGNFNIDVAYESEDEIGQLAEDLRASCSQVKAIVEDTEYMLEAMADGRFDVSSKMKNNYVGDFASLIQSIGKLKQQMDHTLSEIKLSSEQVKVGAEQLSSSAQALAEGATNQASAVEELSATAENVTRIAEESAKNAEAAATNATDAARNARKSREEINQLTSAMERITATSKEIENIIAAIEDIASQTNLLSLNASIEAARAGEAGRGFAVVADQIGKLASDSARSAVTTRELIGKCLDEVQAGNQIVDNTIESFGTVLANMESFASAATGAAEASKSQVDMLKEVELGMDQITTVVECNSAAAEETAAVSEELSAQAIGLEEMLERFVLE